MKKLTIKDIARMAGVSHTEDGYRTGLAYFTRCIKAKKSIATGIHQRSFCLGRHAGGGGDRCGYPWPDFPDWF